MSTRDIHDQIKELYEIEISAEMVSNITNKILPKINDWQIRPLDKMYTFVFMDAIHYKAREDITTLGIKVDNEQVMTIIKALCTIGILLGIMNDNGMETLTWDDKLK